MVSLTKQEQWALIDHINNTKWVMCKAYNLGQISFMDWVGNTATKNSKNVIPVRIDDGTRLYKFRENIMKKGYWVRYLRIDEIESILSKKVGKRMKMVDAEEHERRERKIREMEQLLWLTK